MTSFQTYTGAEIVPLLADVEVFVGTRFQSPWLRQDRTSLCLIHYPGADTEGLNFSAVPSGCRVCNVTGHEHAIAEHVFMVMLALNRRLFAQDAALRPGRLRRSRDTGGASRTHVADPGSGAHRVGAGSLGPVCKDARDRRHLIPFR